MSVPPENHLTNGESTSKGHSCPVRRKNECAIAVHMHIVEHDVVHDSRLLRIDEFIVALRERIVKGQMRPAFIRRLNIMTASTNSAAA